MNATFLTLVSSTSGARCDQARPFEALGPKKKTIELLSLPALQLQVPMMGICFWAR